MYNAIAFPVCAVSFASRCLLTAGFGTHRAICQPGFGEQNVANTDTEASSASERSSCPLVRGDEQRLRLFKTHLHGWEYGCSTRQAVVPRTMTRNESPMPRLTSPHTPVFKAILEFVWYLYPALGMSLFRNKQKDTKCKTGIQFTRPLRYLSVQCPGLGRPQPDVERTVSQLERHGVHSSPTRLGVVSHRGWVMVGGICSWRHSWTWGRWGGVCHDPGWCWRGATGCRDTMQRELKIERGTCRTPSPSQDPTSKRDTPWLVAPTLG